MVTFVGEKLNGQVEYTIVNGHIAYEKGVFDESKKGMRLVFNR
jgi:dihydroorotase